jgi:DNA topoisomerase VI subunit A
MHLERVRVYADRVICIENLTTFHTFSRGQSGALGRIALMCLAGNPSPACRRLLARLADALPEGVALDAWVDMDYGGFNILAQLRRDVSPRFRPYNMDVDTLDRFGQYARPLTQTDRRNLERLANRTELKDVRPVMAEMLKRGLKLEQEAIAI